jgi:beta-galactosidase
MQTIKWNEGWKYWEDKNAFALVWNIPDHAQGIELPHDAMIKNPPSSKSLNGGNTGYRDGGNYHYVKHLNVSEAERDQRLILKFEGVYMNAFVYVNEQLAGKSPFGYSTFYVPLNDYLRYGETNEIRVIVRNGAMTNSRWYTGSGIYRDVYLLKSDLCHIKAEGVQILTESIDSEYAVVKIASEIVNESSTRKEMQLETCIYDEEGECVSKTYTPTTLFAGEERKISERLIIENPKLWSDESPSMYSCTSKLIEKKASDEKVMDESRTSFGIRTLRLDARQGLRVNGRSVKLRGACIHHDSGLLGAATYEEAQYRQVKKLKEAGFNAIRMAHHPMAPAMLRACDDLGVYVMDETFDMWVRGKSDFDYSMFFDEWWERDVEAMVRKNYNHPSVIMYSIGNEIPEIATDQGLRISRKIVDKIKALDPSRYTLASINGVFAAGEVVDQITRDVVEGLDEHEKPEGNVNNFMALMEKHMDKIVLHDEIGKRLDKACATTDIAGYNYMTARYAIDHKEHPNRVIVGSETYPPEIGRNWDIVKNNPHVIGDFTWTGWDYIGEAGVGIPAYAFGQGGFGAQFPCQLAYSGDFDLIGNRRPLSYYREIVFGLRNDPYIAVQDPNHFGEKLIKTPWIMSDTLSSWTWHACLDKSVIVEVYSHCEEVELIQDGKSLGKKQAGSAVGYVTYFETTYKPGQLVAVNYINNQEVGRMELKSAKKSGQIKVSHEEYNQLMYMDIRYVDDEGQLITDQDVTFEVEVEGAATLIGLGSGRPKYDYPYDGNIGQTYHGCALVILKKEKKVNSKSIDLIVKRRIINES